MVITERDRRALILGGLALGAIGIYFLGIEPLLKWHRELTDAHRSDAARVERILTDERKAENVWAYRIKDWEERVGELNPPAEYSEQITVLTEKIMNAAGASGVEMKSPTPSAAIAWADDPGLRQATFTIDGKAGWENAFKFIGALYRIENVLSVENFELTKEKDKMTLKLTVSVFVKASEESRTRWPS